MGTMSEDELAAMFRAVNGGKAIQYAEARQLLEKVKPAHVEYASDLFNISDMDHNKLIDEREFIEVMGAALVRLGAVVDSTMGIVAGTEQQNTAVVVTDEQRAIYEAMFHIVDTDASSSITKNEFREMMSILLPNATDQDLLVGFMAADDDGSKDVDVTEFVEFMSSIKLKCSLKEAKETLHTRYVEKKVRHSQAISKFSEQSEPALSQKPIDRLSIASRTTAPTLPAAPEPLPDPGIVILELEYNVMQEEVRRSVIVTAEAQARKRIDFAIWEYTEEHGPVRRKGPTSYLDRMNMQCVEAHHRMRVQDWERLERGELNQRMTFMYLEKEEREVLVKVAYPNLHWEPEPIQFPLYRTQRWEQDTYPTSLGRQSPRFSPSLEETPPPSTPPSGIKMSLPRSPYSPVPGSWDGVSGITQPVPNPPVPLPPYIQREALPDTLISNLEKMYQPVNHIRW
eukprot:TRINITY_DN13647_c0_g2_i1.p1 TRINITY_DN13647_c0_g2~~TRINITY_DN13647_c0_g2_i1.p1  ORF type:complete len:455 (+),score=107.40 TRINITY_DN13647_c0_g2_i1:37-1401(+)